MLQLRPSVIMEVNAPAVADAEEPSAGAIETAEITTTPAAEDTAETGPPAAAEAAESSQPVAADPTDPELIASTEAEAEPEAAPTSDASEQAAAASEIAAVMRGNSAREELRQSNEAAAKINAAARGHNERSAIRQRQQSATQINAYARGHLTRKHQADANATQDSSAAGEVPMEPMEPTSAGEEAAAPAPVATPSGGREGDDAAARKIGAAERGRRDREAVGKRRAAAARINRIAKGRAARKEAKRRRKEAAIQKAAAAASQAAAAAAAAQEQAQAEKHASATAAAAELPAAKPAATAAAAAAAESKKVAAAAAAAKAADPRPSTTALPMTFAKPPIRYKFVGLDDGESKYNRTYWQTYTIEVEGHHSKAGTKLLITIEVRARSLPPDPSACATCGRAPGLATPPSTARAQQRPTAPFLDLRSTGARAAARAHLSRAHQPRPDRRRLGGDREGTSRRGHVYSDCRRLRGALPSFAGGTQVDDRRARGERVSRTSRHHCLAPCCAGHRACQGCPPSAKLAFVAARSTRTEARLPQTTRFSILLETAICSCAEHRKSSAW